MTNTVAYEARLKAQKWIEPLHLGLGDVPHLTRDMRFVAEAIARLAKENEGLRKRESQSVVASRMANALMQRKLGMDKIAQRISDAAADTPVTVYRSEAGTIRWLGHDAPQPEGWEIVGTYDAGADWRDIAQDIQS